MIRRNRLPALGLPLLLLLLLTSCGAISSPQGWAAPVATPLGILSSVQKGYLTLTSSSTKQPLWTFPNAQQKTTISLQGVYSTPAVTADGQTVVVGAYNGHVYGLKLADGSRLWDYNTKASIVGGVAINGNLAYVGNSDGTFVALDITNNGSVVWSHKVGDRIWSTPLIDNGSVYVTSMDHKLYAWNATDGKQVWVNSDPAGALAGSPTIDSGRIYTGSFDKHVYAIDASSGKEVWQSPKLANWVWTQPLVTGGNVYVGTLDGSVYALDANDGHIVWKKAIDNTPVRSRAALVQGVLVVTDKSGVVEGFDPANGNVEWTQQLHSTTLGDLVTQQDSAGNSVVITVTEGGTGGSHIVQIDPKSGSVTALSA
jgi:outer membrane protein assembly factor BamB